MVWWQILARNIKRKQVQRAQKPHLYLIYLQKNPKNKMPMGHIVHLRKQFKSIYTYDFIITLIKRGKNPLSTIWELNGELKKNISHKETRPSFCMHTVHLISKVLSPNLSSNIKRSNKCFLRLSLLFIYLRLFKRYYAILQLSIFTF